MDLIFSYIQCLMTHVKEEMQFMKKVELNSSVIGPESFKLAKNRFSFLKEQAHAQLARLRLYDYK